MTELDNEAVSLVLPKGLKGGAASVVEVGAGPVKYSLPKGLSTEAAPGLDALCADLVHLQRQRVHIIRQQSRLDRSTEAYLRTQLGYNTHLPERERSRLSAAAARFKHAVEAGQDPYAAGPPGLTRIADAVEIVMAAARNRVPWDVLRRTTEAEMERLAKRLPVHDRFVARVKGVGALGLAVIVGEAGGDIGRFPTRSHFQKRMGLACMDGDVRQGNPGKDATADDWTRHGYNRSRRAQVWSFLDDVMLRAQWRAPVTKGDTIVTEGRALGRYGEFYAWKKAEYVTRGHPAADRAARRYMSKMFLRDLFNAWRDAA